MTKMLPHSRLLAAGIAVGAIVAMSGCSTTPAAEPEPTEEPGYSESTIATFAESTGATPGAADTSLEPIYIGNANHETGPGALPDLTTYLVGAVDLINTELGGINGRPIEVITCDVNSPETGLSCAQDFANDDSILAVVQNSISRGGDAFHSIMDTSGIPIVSALPQSPADGAAPNSYYTASGSFAAVGAISALVRETFDGQSIAMVFPDGDPISANVAGLLGDRLGAAGIEIKQATFSASETDPTAALLAAGVADADVILPAVATPTACLAVAKALDALAIDTPVISLASCTSNVVSDALGDLPEWTYLYSFTNPDAPTSDDISAAQVAAYQEWWEQLDVATVGVIGLQSGLTLQRHILAGGADEATRESVATAAKAWTGPIFLGPETVAYGGKPFAGLPTLAAVRAYTYAGDDSWSAELDGDWLGAPRS